MSVWLARHAHAYARCLQSRSRYTLSALRWLHPPLPCESAIVFTSGALLQPAGSSARCRRRARRRTPLTSRLHRLVAAARRRRSRSGRSPSARQRSTRSRKNGLSGPVAFPPRTTLRTRRTRSTSRRNRAHSASGPTSRRTALLPAAGCRRGVCPSPEKSPRCRRCHARAVRESSRRSHPGETPAARRGPRRRPPPRPAARPRRRRRPATPLSRRSSRSARRPRRRPRSPEGVRRCQPPGHRVPAWGASQTRPWLAAGALAAAARAAVRIRCRRRACWRRSAWVAPGHRHWLRRAPPAQARGGPAAPASRSRRATLATTRSF